MAFPFLRFFRARPEIEKDDKPDPPVIRFFSIYIRKFWYLIRLNLLYFFSCFLFYLPLVFILLVHGLNTIFFYLALFPIILTGPFTAGLTYILRDFVRERPSFLWQDFRDAARSNRKQAFAAAAVGILEFILFWSLFRAEYAARAQSVTYLFMAVLCMLFIFFLFIQFYVYLLMVTFQLSLRQLYRNALIFSLAGFGRNLLSTSAAAAILIASFLVPVLRIFIPFLSLVTAGYIILFCIWPLVKKHLLDQQPQAVSSRTEKRTHGN